MQDEKSETQRFRNIVVTLGVEPFTHLSAEAQVSNDALDLILTPDQVGMSIGTSESRDGAPLPHIEPKA